MSVVGIAEILKCLGLMTHVGAIIEGPPARSDRRRCGAGSRSSCATAEEAVVHVAAAANAAANTAADTTTTTNNDAEQQEAPPRQGAREKKRKRRKALPQKRDHLREVCSRENVDSSLGDFVHEKFYNFG